METQEIGIWFLLLSLIVPRFVLFFWWMTGNLPPNTTPFAADAICAVFLPRVLVMVYIYQNMGLGPWFYIHLVALVIAAGYNLTHFESNMEKLKKFGNA